MTDRRYALAFGAAILTALLATFGVYRVLRHGAAQAAEPLLPLVVVARDVAPGTPIEPGALAVVRWPKSAVPAGAQVVLDSVVGRVARGPLVAGAPVLADQLAPRGAAAGLEGSIAPGYRAMAVRVGDAAGAAGLVRTGSRVDVLVALRDEIGRQVAKLVMSDVRVLAVGTRVEGQLVDAKALVGGGAASPIVTLEVTPAQAERLAVVEGQGTIQIVLRGFGSHDSVATPGADARAVLGLGALPTAATIAALPAPAPAANAQLAQAARALALRAAAADAGANAAANATRAAGAPRPSPADVRVARPADAAALPGGVSAAAVPNGDASPIPVLRGAPASAAAGPSAGRAGAEGGPLVVVRP